MSWWPFAMIMKASSRWGLGYWRSPAMRCTHCARTRTPRGFRSTCSVIIGHMGRFPKPLGYSTMRRDALVAAPSSWTLRESSSGNRSTRSMSPARWPPYGGRSRIYDGRVSLTGEYEPSPRKQTREQVERYEATVGRKANTLAGPHNRPVVLFTTRGRKAARSER